VKIEEQFKYSQLGDSYWWLAGKYLLITKLLKKVLDKQYKKGRKSLKILDIGCGPGNLSNNLSNIGEVFGIDVSLPTLKLCQKKYSNLINGKADELPIREGSFDIVILLDVLEHIADDAKVMKETFRILKPGGIVLITAPACKILWGSHDEIYQHYRRYSLDEIKKVVRRAGFTIKKLIAFEAIFFIPLLLFRKIKNVLNYSKRDDFIKIPNWLNSILTVIVLLEGRISYNINNPLGVSIICIAKKE